MGEALDRIANEYKQSLVEQRLELERDKAECSEKTSRRLEDKAARMSNYRATGRWDKSPVVVAKDDEDLLQDEKGKTLYPMQFSEGSDRYGLYWYIASYPSGHTGFVLVMWDGKEWINVFSQSPVTQDGYVVSKRKNAPLKLRS